MSRDRVSADLAAHEAEQDARQRSFDTYEHQATAAVRDALLEQGFTATEADAFLLTGDGADLIEAEVCSLELQAEDAYIDAQIDARRDRFQH